MIKHGVIGTESRIRLRWERGTTEKCKFEANFCLRGVRFSFGPDWVSLREHGSCFAAGTFYSEGVCNCQPLTAIFAQAREVC